MIPARGGSKRIPKKNIRKFRGRSLLERAIETAHRSNLFDAVMVNTDENEIAEIAVKSGASIPFLRSSELADDTAGMTAVISDFLDWCELNGQLPEYLCCIYPTAAPFLSRATLEGCFNLLLQEKCISTLTVTSYPYPIHRALQLDSKGKVAFLWDENRYARSQDLPECFHDAGQCYWFDVDRFRHEPVTIGKDTAGYVLPRWCVQDIDTEEDWSVAERLFSLQ